MREFSVCDVWVRSFVLNQNEWNSNTLPAKTARNRIHFDARSHTHTHTAHTHPHRNSFDKFWMKIYITATARYNSISHSSSVSVRTERLCTSAVRPLASHFVSHIRLCRCRPSSSAHFAQCDCLVLDSVECACVCKSERSLMLWLTIKHIFNGTHRWHQLKFEKLAQSEERTKRCNKQMRRRNSANSESDRPNALKWIQQHEHLILIKLEMSKSDKTHKTRIQLLLPFLCRKTFFSDVCLHKRRSAIRSENALCVNAFCMSFDECGHCLLRTDFSSQQKSV